MTAGELGEKRERKREKEKERERRERESLDSNRVSYMYYVQKKYVE
jgi:hypothetical protein